MSSIRQMMAEDLFDFDTCNLDPLTETYNIGFYLEYLAKWPDLCWIIESQVGQIEAYILGKVEASPNAKPTKEPYHPDTNKNMNYLPWHAHITALTVAPNCRRRGHAQKLSRLLEEEGEKQNAWFVDLFVRKDNVAAIALYKTMGYSVFRRVRDYYSDGTDALDMRKALPRDKKRQTIRDNGENFIVEPQDVWVNHASDEIKAVQTLRRHKLRTEVASIDTASGSLLPRPIIFPRADPYPENWIGPGPPTPPESESEFEPEHEPSHLSETALLELNQIITETPPLRSYAIPSHASRDVAAHLEIAFLVNLSNTFRTVEDCLIFMSARLFARRDGLDFEALSNTEGTRLPLTDLERQTINLCQLFITVIDQCITASNTRDMGKQCGTLTVLVLRGIELLNHFQSLIETGQDTQLAQDWKAMFTASEDMQEAYQDTLEEQREKLEHRQEELVARLNALKLPEVVKGD